MSTKSNTTTGAKGGAERARKKRHITHSSPKLMKSSDIKEFILNSHEIIKEQQNFVLRKIENWLHENELSNNSQQIKNQNKKELIDFGAFICSYNIEIEIIEGLRESPDFIIALNQKRIGVELRDFCRQDEIRKENVLKMLFDNVEKEIKTVNPDLTGFFNVSLNEIILDRKDYLPFKTELFKKICNENIETKYIKSIRQSKSSKLHIYSGQGYCVGGITSDMILNAISEKEIKLNSYLSDNQLDEIWLLNVIGGLGTSSDYSYIDKSLTKNDLTSCFDKIFLFDFFRKEVIELKVNNKK